MIGNIRWLVGTCMFFAMPHSLGAKESDEATQQCAKQAAACGTAYALEDYPKLRSCLHPKIGSGVAGDFFEAASRRGRAEARAKGLEFSKAEVTPPTALVRVGK